MQMPSASLSVCLSLLLVVDFLVTVVWVYSSCQFVRRRSLLFIMLFAVFRVRLLIVVRRCLSFDVVYC